MKNAARFVLFVSVLMVASANAQQGNGPRPPVRPRATVQPPLSDTQLQTVLNEQNFAECESSPGGTAIIPTEQLRGLVQPTAANTRNGTNGGGTSR